MSSARGKGDASGSGSKKGKGKLVKAEPSTNMCDDTPYVLDSADPIREYIGLDFEEECKKLLFVTVEKTKKELAANKMYVVTSVTQLLLNKNDFKVSCTKCGNIYVLTATEHDATKLDGQVFSVLGGFVRYEKSDTVNPEIIDVMTPEAATFKLFESKGI